MRTLVFLSTLALTACTSNNPFFGLDTDTTTSSSTSTSNSTTVDPPTTTDPTGPGTTTDTITTAGPTTESPTTPVTSSSSDPSTTTLDPDTTTGVAESSTSGSSTGAEFCELGITDFSGFLYQGNAKDPALLCPDPVTYFPNTKLLKGGGPLRLGSCTNPPAPELTIGKGYDLPVPADSPCGKLYLYRDGDGPLCDISHFRFIAEQKPYAAGSFSAQQPPPNPPPAALVTLVEEVPWEPCCPMEAKDCCPEGLGDYSLAFSGIPEPILPGELVENIPGPDNTLFSVINIQTWISATCDPIVYAHTSDWASVRTK